MPTINDTRVHMPTGSGRTGGDVKKKHYDDSTSRIREARRLYDIRTVLGITDNRRVIVCPLPMHPHHNNTPSFSIYMENGVQKFRCHGTCNRGGDVVDLAGYVHIVGYDPYNSEHVKRALTLLESGYRTCPPKAGPKAPALSNTAYQDFLPPGPEVIEYARSRGLAPDTLKHFNVGQSGMWGKTWMTMPTHHMGRLMGVKMRNLNATSHKDRYTSLPGSIGGLFNYNDVFYETGPLLIVKAEIPAMLLWQHGFKVCAPTSGEASAQAELYFAMVWSRKRVVVADNDLDENVRAAMDRAAARRAEAFHAVLKRPPLEYKDIDQFFVAEPDYALSLIRSWMEE